jgi:NADH dehydrogenase
MFLVAGGTGFLSSAIVRELLNRGETVAVLGRDETRIRGRFGSDVEPRAADVRDAASLTTALAGADVVINAVQFPNSPIEDRRRGRTFEAVDYRGTVNEVDAAKEAGARRFVYLSGVGAAPDATKHWFRFKWQAEQHLRSSGLEWVAIRPTWVYGPEDNSLNRLLRFGRFLPFIPNFGNGKQAMQPVFIDDVGRVVADAAQRPEAANQLFELGGPEVMTMDAVLKTALDVMGKRRFLLHQPVFAGKAIGTVASLLPSPPLTADAVDFVTEPAVADNSNLERVLRPALTPLRQGLETYLRPKP